MEKPPTVRISLPPKPLRGSTSFVIGTEASRALDELPLIEQVNNAILKCLELSAEVIQFRTDNYSGIEVFAIIRGHMGVWVQTGVIPRWNQSPIMGRLKVLANMAITARGEVLFGKIDFNPEPLSTKPGVKFNAVFIPGDAHFPTQFILSRG